MTPAWLRCALAPLFLATLCAAPASAQGLEGQVGRFYDDEGWDIYRLGMSRALTGPLGLGLQANYLQRAQGGDGALAGLSLDLTAFKGAGQGPYLVAGVGAGMGSSAGNDFSDAWGSWSVGGGYQLLPASFLSFAAEARWRELSLDSRDGLEMAAGLSIRFGGRGGGSPAAGGHAGCRASATDGGPTLGSPASCRRTGRGPLAPGRRRHREGRDGPAVRVGWHGRERRRIRLLRPHPARLRAARCQAATRKPRPGEGGEADRSQPDLTPARRPADLLELRRTGHPRGTLHRGRSLHPQREPWGASEPVERR